MTIHSPPTPEIRPHLRDRITRLAERLRDRRLAGALITDPRDIAYFAGSPLGVPAPACLLIRVSGETHLIHAEGATNQIADQHTPFPWHTGGTIATDLAARMSAAASNQFRLSSEHLGFQQESTLSHLVASFPHATWTPIDDVLLDLQRRKDPLDLFRIRLAIAANLAALAAAAETIAPGISEISVFAAAYRGALQHAGEPVQHDGDYRCGATGGKASDRPLAAGDLYIIDAWTNRRGYWSDLARVFPVGTPTALQLDLIEHTRSVHATIRPLLRPGTTGGDLWSATDAAIRRHAPLAQLGLVHHAGHGIGLRLHEPPDLNPGVTDALREGDVICLEPAGYPPFARAGARYEDTYLITRDGAVCLSDGSSAPSPPPGPRPAAN